MSDAEFLSADPRGRGWHVRLRHLTASVRADRLEDVRAVLARADRAARDGHWAAVVLAYDAAPALTPKMHVPGPRDPLAPPLAWVGVYARAEALDGRVGPGVAAPGIAPAGSDAPSSPPPGMTLPHFHPHVSRAVFGDQVRAVRTGIAEGDTYQVNLTFPTSAPAPTDPRAWYEALRARQRAPYCAWVDMGSHLVVSLSPELFFERRGTTVVTRPMKGTAPRGRWWQEDEALARELAASVKARAENVMIVDLLRNDLGRLADVGSVQVPELFTLERYPTLLQLTSSVTASVGRDVSTSALLEALFPCGSVTGAPKLRTMAIIAGLERAPRGLYTGTVGVVAPGGDCTFNVAIRTVVIDRARQRATMGIGAGITFDSDPGGEYDECLLKAAFLAAASPDDPPGAWDLLETMRLENGVVARLERHLARLSASARYFDRPWQEAAVREALAAACTAHPRGTWRLRLVTDAAGQPSWRCTAQASPTAAGAPPTWRVAFAPDPVNTESPWLFNKTTHRAVYERARAARPGFDDVLLWNAAGEVTESTIANLVVELQGQRVTPPVTSGLLPGCYRAELLDSGVLVERVLTRADVRRASRLWLVNSLRGWIDARLTDT